MADPVASGVRTTKTLRDYVRHTRECLLGRTVMPQPCPRCGQPMFWVSYGTTGHHAGQERLGDWGCVRHEPPSYIRKEHGAVYHCTCGLDALLALPETRDQPQGKEQDDAK
jgi:hypothetical protein